VEFKPYRALRCVALPCCAVRHRPASGVNETLTRASLFQFHSSVERRSINVSLLVIHNGSSPSTLDTSDHSAVHNTPLNTQNTDSSAQLQQPLHLTAYHRRQYDHHYVDAVAAPRGVRDVYTPFTTPL